MKIKWKTYFKSFLITVGVLLFLDFVGIVGVAKFIIGIILATLTLIIVDENE